MTNTLQGKVAIVTGAGRGIGAGIARFLGSQGCRVVVNYAHSQDGAEQVVSEILANGSDAFSYKANVADYSEIEGLMSKVIEKYGKIDIIVNNAAIDPTIDFFSVTEEFWDRVIDTNLKGTFFCSQIAAKEMVRSGGGKIINISSVHGNTTMHHYAAYAASKGGINALTRQMALDLSKFRINVNAIAPGVIEVEKYGDFPWFNREIEGKKIPWGRVGTPSDVAPLVGFLASEESDFITGQIFTVDGGSSTRFFLWEKPILVD